MQHCDLPGVLMLCRQEKVEVALRIYAIKCKRGFTLVELLVVIGIIGVLISLLMPSYTKARGAANKAVCESNMRQIGQAMMMYADACNGFLFPDAMGADAEHITDFPLQPTSPTGPAVPPYAPGSIDVKGNVVYYVTWPGMVLGGWAGMPPSLPASSPLPVDQTLLKFTQTATGPVMFCPSDDPTPYGYHSYMVNEHLAYWNLKFSSKLPNGQSPSNVVLMGEKITAVSNYYMKNGDYAAGKIETKRHGIIAGSNYLFLDFHVDSSLNPPGPDALDPWDFANGQAPPGTPAPLPPSE